MALMAARKARYSPKRREAYGSAVDRRGMVLGAWGPVKAQPRRLTGPRARASASASAPRKGEHAVASLVQGTCGGGAASSSGATAGEERGDGGLMPYRRRTLEAGKRLCFDIGKHLVRLALCAEGWSASVDGLALEGRYQNEAQAWE